MSVEQWPLGLQDRHPGPDEQEGVDSLFGPFPVQSCASSALSTRGNGALEWSRWFEAGMRLRPTAWPHLRRTSPSAPPGRRASVRFPLPRSPDRRRRVGGDLRRAARAWQAACVGCRASIPAVIHLSGCTRYAGFGLLHSLFPEFELKRPTTQKKPASFASSQRCAIVYDGRVCPSQSLTIRSSEFFGRSDPGRHLLSWLFTGQIECSSHRVCGGFYWLRPHTTVITACLHDQRLHSSSCTCSPSRRRP
jgi:hypothetical protein